MAHGKRGNVTITYNEKRDRWEAKISAGPDPVTGKPKRQLIVGATEKAVAEDVQAAYERMDKGLTAYVENRTVRKFLMDWLTEDADSRKDSTNASYRNIVNLYILPTLGSKKVAKLRPRDIKVMLTKLADDGKSGNTRRLALSTLRAAFRWGVEEDYLAENVAGKVRGVKITDSKAGRTLTVEQAKTLLAATEGEPLAAAWIVALTTGLRRGELLGLSWDDVDLTVPSIRVHQSLKRIPRVGLELSDPKTEGSTRTIRLTTMAVTALKDHRKRQYEDRLRLGASWEALPLGADLVFRTPLGTAVDPDNFRGATYKLTERALGERWSPHELRHTAASFLFAGGVDLKIISETLGHSSIRITSEVYTHLLDGASAVAANAMETVLTADA